MAVHNITYKNKEIDKLINNELGKAFSFFKKLKIGSIGSRRLIIENFSDGLNNLKMNVSGIQYANIEIRPLGVIVHINKGIYTYAWTIPFYQLSIFNGDFFTLHSQGQFIQFNKIKSIKENKAFINKLFELKANFMPQ